MDKLKRIRLRGHGDFLLLEDEEGGAIATREAMENFEDSYAHWYRNDGPDGRGSVMRYHEEIGTNADIEFLDGEEEVDFSGDAAVAGAIAFEYDLAFGSAALFPSDAPLGLGSGPAYSMEREPSKSGKTMLIKTYRDGELVSTRREKVASK